MINAGGSVGFASSLSSQYCITMFFMYKTPTAAVSGGFRGYAGYAAAYPIDWTGCFFVTFNF